MTNPQIYRRSLLALSGLALLGGCQRALPKNESSVSLGVSYVIRDGDLVEDIAQACSISVDELCYHNKMQKGEFRSGRRIVLPYQNFCPLSLRGPHSRNSVPEGEPRFQLAYPDLPNSSRIMQRTSWSAEKTKSNVNPMNRVDRITLHHTSEYPGMNELNDIQTIQAIARYHRDHLGWADIGYHYLIGRDGRIYEGRPRQLQGAHVGGHNENNLGITVIGDFVKKLPSDRQLDTLKWFLSDQLQYSHLGIGKLYGHRDLKATQCPGEQLYRWLQRYRQSSV
jgi:hypothetical protein